MKISGRFSWILAVVTILSQALVIVIGAVFLLNMPYILSHLQVNMANAEWSPDWPQFFKGIAMAMVAYTGVEAMAQLAAETRKPSVAIPRAIKWTIVVLLVLYLGISLIGLSVMSPQELGTTYLNDPIGGIILHLPFGGSWLAAWFGLIAAVILLLSANAGLIGCSRLTFSMGEFYQMPRMFFQLHGRFRTPYIALAIFSALAAVVVILSQGQLLFLADLYNFGAQIAFFSAHISLIVLRCKKPTLHRPYKAPFNIPCGKNRSIPLTAVIGAIATFGVWLLVIITKAEGRNAGFLWLAFGVGMYLLYRRKKKLPALGKLAIEKIKIPEFKPMHLRHILVTAHYQGKTDALQTACQLAKNFGAQITAVTIMEMPPSLPMDAPMEKKEGQGEAALKRAEAIAREYHLNIDLKLLRARSMESAITELVRNHEYDMVILAIRKEETKRESVQQMEKILSRIPCRVLLTLS